MKQKSLISVVMPVYNGGKYLREAIESILNQTYQNFEFLIINDGSTDTSEKIIYSYTDPRIVYLQNDKNRGLVYTLNYGISVAKGKYIARMDADDNSEPTRFERQLEVFSNDPKLGVCGTWAKVIDSREVLKVETENDRIKCGLFFTNQFIHSSVMFSKIQLLNSGLFYDEKDFPAEDYGLWIKLSQSVKMVNIPECLLRYRVHPSQISIASSERQIKKTHELRVSQIERFLNYKPTEEEKGFHLLFLNYKVYVHGKSDIICIHKWLIKLESLNYMHGYYNYLAFNACIEKYFSRRFIYQNYKNNNPLFLVNFYLFYLRSKYRFNLIFHLQFTIKCLIFYKMYEKSSSLNNYSLL